MTPAPSVVAIVATDAAAVTDDHRQRNVPHQQLQLEAAAMESNKQPGEHNLVVPATPREEAAPSLSEEEKTGETT